MKRSLIPDGKMGMLTVKGYGRYKYDIRSCTKVLLMSYSRLPQWNYREAYHHSIDTLITYGNACRSWSTLPCMWAYMPDVAFGPGYAIFQVGWERKGCFAEKINFCTA
jgi:hypothetical protein